MNRVPRSFAILTIALVTIAAPGCRGKKAQTPPDVDLAAAKPAPVAPATPTAQPTAPSDPLAGDLDSVNRYLREQGLLGPVYFDFDSADLRADAKSQLSKNAEFLRNHPQFEIAVEGHCDERGTNDYNLALGDRRAGTTHGYLAQLGIPKDRLRPVSFGEERPECRSSDESCWARNRRAEFVVVGRRS